MIQEHKELLLKDLCARLPYGVNMKTCHCKLTETLKTYMDVNHLIDIGWLPYLRPMSSMTEEEVEEFYDFSDKLFKYKASEKIWGEIVDWMNEHYFDYRGLIDKDLALEAPKGMYKYV